MNLGMDSIVYVFYHNALGTLVLLPFFIIHLFRFRFFILGLLWICICQGVYAVVFRCNALTWYLRKKGPVFVAMFSPFSIVIAIIMGVTFLGDSLYLGSAIGAAIVTVGFYTVMWGQAKEDNKLPMEMEEDLDVADEPESSNQNTPLLSSSNESNC